jgi:hypothetical protein
MIIMKLKGGLGNQLFQYALGRRLTYSNNVQLKLDISSYGTYKLHSYGIHHFNIVENIATEDDLKALGIMEGKGLRTVLSKALEKRKLIHNPHRLNERLWAFDPDILNVSDNVYLDGYWASEKYFSEIAEVIRTELTPRERLDRINEEMASEIAGASSVSVHIRRGDYVTNPETNKVHGTCSLKYYNKCISEMALKVRDPHFYVFSDDVQWTKKNLIIEHPVTYVDHNNQENDFKDLYLMSKCKHHIIANSSFSWWGAWLSTSKDHIVFATSRWLTPGRTDVQDIIPERWLRVDSQTGEYADSV